jgi:transcriptional regulator with XRE-family HTH domain
MATNNLKQKIDIALSRHPSRWMEKALQDELNEVWLERSADIALRILSTLQANGMSQKELAEKIGVSPQQINKIVKGRENLTLETISKLEKALGIVILTLPASIKSKAHNAPAFSSEQTKSTAKKSVAKTVKVLQKGITAGKVNETGCSYGNEVT